MHVGLGLLLLLQHPAQLLQTYPAAELMVSTDCLSVRAVVERRPEVYRCGMQPGGWNSAWNTGGGVRRAALLLSSFYLSVPARLLRAPRTLNV